MSRSSYTTMVPVDAALNVGFFVFHTAWIVFNLLGWAWRRTRPWHLGTMALTVLSWFGLGWWFGWGYCPCTDWHWRIRARMGFTDPPSYVQLLIRELTGLELQPVLANLLTLGTLVAVGGLSVVLNLKDRRAAAR